MKHSLAIKKPDFDFDSFNQEFNNFLRDTLFETSFASPLHLKMTSTWRPAIEVQQTEKEYKVKVQLPGVNKEDIHVDLNNDFMTVTAEIKEEKDKKEASKMHTCEIRYGKYVRTIAFDTPIKTADSSAEYKNGILTVTMPKQKITKTQTKRLTVK
ncbi:MAG TPA: Hsp20/alpha crystallin family protein [Candidatus Gastranaerophilaceae bacterium]|nr:Hsp20/alpha crystallin family protein [Candidatus Gastranaerophilaceae bacterium]HPT41236.1 Hsp20/alpha crystallin family protein [Candidatus Gastranaerophilaceae bacterium]